MDVSWYFAINFVCVCYSTHFSFYFYVNFNILQRKVKRVKKERARKEKARVVRIILL